MAKKLTDILESRGHKILATKLKQIETKKKIASGEIKVGANRESGIVVHNGENDHEEQKRKDEIPIKEGSKYKELFQDKSEWKKKAESLGGYVSGNNATHTKKGTIGTWNKNAGEGYIYHDELPKLKEESLIEEVNHEDELKKEYNIYKDRGDTVIHHKSGKDRPYRITHEDGVHTLRQGYQQRIHLPVKWSKVKSSENISDLHKAIIKRHNKSAEYMPGWKKLNEELLDEAVKTGNEGYGYHGTHSENADENYSKTHAKVKKVVGEAGHLKDVKNPNVTIKHYLDSNRGKHLKGREDDHEYIAKDFSKFKREYKPELHEGVVPEAPSHLSPAERKKWLDDYLENHYKHSVKASKDTQNLAAELAKQREKRIYGESTELDEGKSLSGMDKHIKNTQKNLKGTDAHPYINRLTGQAIPNHKVVHVSKDVSHQKIYDHLAKHGFQHPRGWGQDRKSLYIRHSSESMITHSDSMHHPDGTSVHLEHEHGDKHQKLIFTHRPIKESLDEAKKDGYNTDIESHGKIHKEINRDYRKTNKFGYIGGIEHSHISADGNHAVLAWRHMGIGSGGNKTTHMVGDFHKGEDGVWKHKGIHARAGQRNIKQKIQEFKDRKLNESIELNMNEEYHRVIVTVSEPDHPSVIQRKVQKERRAKVKASSKEAAVEIAKKHYKKYGYKVHGAEHIEQLKEESLPINESMNEVDGNKILHDSDGKGETNIKWDMTKHKSVYAAHNHVLGILKKDAIEPKIKQKTGTHHEFYFKDGSSSTIKTVESNGRIISSFNHIRRMNEETTLEESPSSENHAAHNSLVSNAGHSYSGKGHYLKKDGKYVSKRHDSADSAMTTWRNMSDHEKKGIKIVHEDYENDMIIDENTEHDHILQSLANNDINADIKNGKVVVHNSNIGKAKSHIKKLGHDIPVIGGLNEKVEEMKSFKFSEYLNEKTSEIIEDTIETKSGYCLKSGDEVISVYFESASDAIKEWDSLEENQDIEIVFEDYTIDINEEAKAHYRSTLPASRILHDKNKSSLKDIHDTWGNDKMTVHVVSDREGKHKYFVGSGHTNEKVGDIIYAKHDQTQKDLGSHTIRNKIHLENGKIVHKDNDIGVDKPHPMHVFK